MALWPRLTPSAQRCAIKALVQLSAAPSAAEVYQRFLKYQLRKIRGHSRTYNRLPHNDKSMAVTCSVTTRTQVVLCRMVLCEFYRTNQLFYSTFLVRESHTIQGGMVITLCHNQKPRHIPITRVCRLQVLRCRKIMPAAGSWFLCEAQPQLGGFMQFKPVLLSFSNLWTVFFKKF